MLRVLVRIATFLLFREFVLRRPRCSPTAISPYKNSIGSIMTTQEVSLAMDRSFLIGRRLDRSLECSAFASTSDRITEY
jgi:hypothetical protein